MHRLVAAIVHRHQDRLIRELTRRRGNIGKSRRQINQNVAIETPRHMDELRQRIQCDRLRKIRLCRPAKYLQIPSGIDEVRLQRHRREELDIPHRFDQCRLRIQIEKDRHITELQITVKDRDRLSRPLGDARGEIGDQCRLAALSLRAEEGDHTRRRAQRGAVRIPDRRLQLIRREWLDHIPLCAAAQQPGLRLRVPAAGETDDQGLPAILLEIGKQTDIGLAVDIQKDQIRTECLHLPQSIARSLIPRRQLEARAVSDHARQPLKHHAVVLDEDCTIGHGIRLQLKGSTGSRGSEGSTGVVRRIICI